MRTLAMRSATRYFCPSFSNSAITQSVMYGVALAYRQSSMDCTTSSCERSPGAPQFPPGSLSLSKERLSGTLRRGMGERPAAADIVRFTPPTREVDTMLRPGGLRGGRFYLVADGEVDEVGVYEHLVGRTQRRVVLEEQRRRCRLPVIPPTTAVVGVCCSRRLATRLVSLVSWPGRH